MFTVYVIENSSGKVYVGYTNDIERRFDQHNDPARESWASRRGPWKLIYREEHKSRAEAMKAERYLKSFKNKDTMANYIAGWRKSTSQGS
ncbi:MAG TPA: GIY-YIG nuclease family protein [Candidatus Paceibacterota bacterium]